MASAPVGIFRYAPEGNCVYVNAYCCDIYDLSAEALMAGQWHERLHPDDRDRILALWAVFQANHEPIQVEYQLLLPDGTVKWVYAQVAVERDANGHVTGYVGSVTDISERKRSEAALAEGETQNRAILAAIPDLLFRVGADWMHRGFVIGNRQLDVIAATVDPTNRPLREVVPLLEFRLES